MAPRRTLRAGSRTFELGERLWLMGVVNANDDSFSGAGEDVTGADVDDVRAGHVLAGARERVVVRVDDAHQPRPLAQLERLRAGAQRAAGGGHAAGVYPMRNVRETTAALPALS